jgi:hypothetical protein
MDNAIRSNRGRAEVHSNTDEQDHEHG